MYLCIYYSSCRHVFFFSQHKLYCILARAKIRVKWRNYIRVPVGCCIYIPSNSIYCRMCILVFLYVAAYAFIVFSHTVAQVYLHSCVLLYMGSRYFRILPHKYICIAVCCCICVHSNSAYYRISLLAVQHITVYYNGMNPQ